MPTYEYECLACGQHIEVFQRFSEDPLTTCGVCGGTLRKVFHPAGIVFKGSGFYATDSRSKSESASRKDGAKVSDPKSSGDGGSKPSGDGSKASGDTGSKASPDGGSSPTQAKGTSS